MKLSERIRNKAWSFIYPEDRFIVADEVAQIESGNERLRELLKKQTLWSDEAINSLLRKETPCP